MSTTLKSEKRSISFSPGDLYTWAKSHGEGLTPTKTVSAVVCDAVKEYRERVAPRDSKESQVLAAARRVGLDNALNALVSHRAAKSRKA